MVVLGFFGLFGRVLKVVLPDVSPVSVAGIFRGQHSVLWLATEIGEMLGRTTFRTRPKSPKKPTATPPQKERERLASTHLEFPLLWFFKYKFLPYKAVKIISETEADSSVNSVASCQTQ